MAAGVTDSAAGVPKPRSVIMALSMMSGSSPMRSKVSARAASDGGVVAGLRGDGCFRLATSGRSVAVHHVLSCDRGGVEVVTFLLGKLVGTAFFMGCAGQPGRGVVEVTGVQFPTSWGVVVVVNCSRTWSTAWLGGTEAILRASHCSRSSRTARTNASDSRISNCRRVTALAASGTAITARHLAALAEVVPSKRIVVALDGDPAGRAATLAVGEKLAAAGWLARIPTAAPGTDPAQLAAEKGREVFLDWLRPANCQPLIYRATADLLAEYDISEPFFADKAARATSVYLIEHYPAGQERHHAINVAHDLCHIARPAATRYLDATAALAQLAAAAAPGGATAGYADRTYRPPGPAPPPYPDEPSMRWICPAGHDHQSAAATLWRAISGADCTDRGDIQGG